MKGVVAAAIATLCVGTAAVADLVAVKTIRAGSIIAEGDLKVTGETSEALLGELVGQEARRSLYAGRPISRDDIGPPTLVHRNDEVVIIYRFGRLGLRTEGRSLGAGGLGERISVMNLDTRNMIQATVRGEAWVEVTR